MVSASTSVAPNSQRFWRSRAGREPARASSPLKRLSLRARSGNRAVFQAPVLFKLGGDYEPERPVRGTHPSGRGTRSGSP
jgi:hypothetical protein